jgi:flagellar hook assembly protein FlgD
MKRCVIPRATVLLALMCATALVPAHVRAAEEKEVSVGMPSFAQAPATVQLNVRVAPRKENRLLRVTLDSGTYYRSSDLPLEGAEAATMHSVRWPGVPSGEYVVIVELFRSNGKRHVAHAGRLEVVGFGR